MNRQTNTARIELTEYNDADVARWKELVAHDIEGEFSFDFDKGGRLLGIEIRFASQGLPAEFIDEAQSE